MIVEGIRAKSHINLKSEAAVCPFPPQAPASAPKPRILVCAPSNAATDELLERILREGFKDFGGGR